MQGQHTLSNERNALSSAGSRLARREQPKNLLGAVVGDTGGQGLINGSAGFALGNHLETPHEQHLAAAGCRDPGQLAKS
jgi:hypothetical protein